MVDTERGRLSDWALTLELDAAAANVEYCWNGAILSAG